MLFVLRLFGLGFDFCFGFGSDLGSGVGVGLGSGFGSGFLGMGLGKWSRLRNSSGFFGLWTKFTPSSLKGVKTSGCSARRTQVGISLPTDFLLRRSVPRSFHLMHAQRPVWRVSSRTM